MCKPICAEPLKPIVGQHNAYKGVNMRQQNDEYDTWNHRYLDVVKRLQLVTDSAVDEYLGKKRACRPSIRRRGDCSMVAITTPNQSSVGMCHQKRTELIAKCCAASV